MAGSGTAHLRDRDVLLRVDALEVSYKTRGGTIHAVSGISFDVLRGETLGIVGESGCGKSTTGRAVLRLSEVSGGKVTFDGADITAAGRADVRRLRRRMQLIFQDPVASLNPRRRVRDLVVEGLAVAGASRERRREVSAKVLASVGLPAERFADRFPRELSGGQAQRVALARALAVEPELVICDEAVSALDVSVQAKIINLIEDLKAQYSLTVIFIAHDLGVVRTVSDRVMVMYLGKACEIGAPEDVYARPAHPYTRALLDSVPMPDDARGFAGPALAGEMPSPLSPPTGCRFRTRCPRVQDVCALEEPLMHATDVPDRFVACHFPLTAATG